MKLGNVILKMNKNKLLKSLLMTIILIIVMVLPSTGAYNNFEKSSVDTNQESETAVYDTNSWKNTERTDSNNPYNLDQIGKSEKDSFIASDEFYGNQIFAFLLRQFPYMPIESGNGDDVVDGGDQGHIWYVNDTATGSNTGLNWDDAFKDLQDALAAVQPGDQIWVANGTYKPDQGLGFTPGDRSASFDLLVDIDIYGGFDGTESSLNERAGLFDQTILSGDLEGNDIVNWPNWDPYGNGDNYDDNSYHVISAINIAGVLVFNQV